MITTLTSSTTTSLRPVARPRPASAVRHGVSAPSAPSARTSVMPAGTTTNPWLGGTGLGADDCFHVATTRITPGDLGGST